MESFTNIYRFVTGQSGSYGHKWKNVVVTDLVQLNRILERDGVIGGINGNLYEQCNPNFANIQSRNFQAMTLTRFVEINRNMKLCNNNAAKSRD